MNVFFQEGLLSLIKFRLDIARYSFHVWFRLGRLLGGDPAFFLGEKTKGLLREQKTRVDFEKQNVSISLF